MLTDKEIQHAKPRAKLYRILDAKQLYLEVTPLGAKWWRLRYLLGGKENMVSLGRYPLVRAPEARLKAYELRQALSEGRDPMAEKREKKRKALTAEQTTFEAIAKAWHSRVTLAANTRTKHNYFFEHDVFPYIGKRPIAELAAPDLLAIIRRIEGRGAMDIARRVHNLCGRVFRYAVGHGLCDRDPSRDIEIKDILPAERVKHHASITNPADAGALLRAIDIFTGSFVTRCALRFAPLVFVRPGELRHAEWAEISLDKAEWRIPAEKMKMHEQHIVPLSRQAITTLQAIQPLTGQGRYVFPSERTTQRPMSENTVNAALRRLGYSKTEMTGHGFRSMASTLLHELGHPHAVIEAQLAHAERNKVSASYNHAQYLPERRAMMQSWADYLDGLRAAHQEPL